MNELEEIRTFVRLVEAGSLTKAAASRGVAVSAISRRMKDLETRLGVQLLQRTTRKMHLTNAGRLYYERCTQLLSDFADAEAEVTDSQQVLRGRLRMSVPLSFGNAHLVPAILDFMTLYPEIRVELDMSDRHVDLVEDGYELAVRIGTLRDSNLVARKVADFRHVVCASAEFLARFGRPAHPRDLHGLPGLCYSQLRRPNVWRYQSASGESGEVEVAARLTASNGDALCAAGVAGFGILCEPSFVVHDAVERGLLEPLLTEYRWYDMAVYVVYPPTRHLAPRVRRFIDFMVERFGNEPYWNAFLR